MATVKKRTDFFTSPEGLKVKEELRRMVEDEAFFTESSYSADFEKYTDNLIPFVDKHMNYLRTHPSVEIDHYLANLRLMTRLKRR